MTRITENQVDSAEDQGAITFYTAGVERGRISGEGTSTLGGGFQIGTSYLIAHNKPLVAQVSNVNSNISWEITDPLEGVDGTDLEIDAGDDTKINVLTTGGYSIEGYLLFDNANNVACNGVIDINQVKPGPSNITLRYLTYSGSAEEMAHVGVARPFALLDWEFEAGDVIRLDTVQQTADSDTWSLSGNVYNIVVARQW